MKTKKVDDYIEMQKSPQKEICHALREIIFKTFPDIEEEMRWGVPSYDQGRYYFVALKTHVNLGFSIKGLAEEQIKFFSGSGKTMRTVEIKSLQDINEIEIGTLLKNVK